MENLKKFLQSKENQILTNLKTGEPNEQQLNNFTLNFTNQLEQLTLQAPSEVKRICQNGIVSIGWDSKRRQRIPTSTMTSSTVLSGIRQIQTDLENLNPPIEPNANELADISIAANRLWDLDVNRLIPQTDYIINVQGGKKIYNEGDAASEPFFTYVDASVFERPTYRAFRQLLDNYVAETGVAENVTTEERRENQTFLNLIADTPVMKYCHRYLVLKGYAPADKNEFINLLNDLWFGLYKREVQNDSSGFEHVFLGEIKDGEVTGLHNWIQLYDEEKSHRLDYLGYILPKRNPSVGGYRVSAQDQQLVTIQFTWKGFLKKCSSSFIGTSPEFEIALYTICFLQQQEKYLVNCGPYRVEITCYKYTSRGKNYIGTCFPTDAPLDENEAASKIQSSYRGQSARKTK